jgi:N-acetyl-alpha-D-muramate 1-phosphate uridylyltransferase
MQCVILAGGLGTRLWPMTQTLPKCLIPINGRPFADYQLTWLARQNITDIVYCIGYLGGQIRAAVGDGSRFGLTVRYADEGEDLKGTGGALRGAFDAGFLAEIFFVLYGDSFLPVQFAPVLAAFRASKCRALMTVMRNENRWDTSNAVFAAPFVTLYDKQCDEATRARMNYIDYGMSILACDLIAQEIQAGAKADLADLFKSMSLAGELAGFEITDRFYEVGSQSGIAEFSRFAEHAGL